MTYIMTYSTTFIQSDITSSKHTSRVSQYNNPHLQVTRLSDVQPDASNVYRCIS